MRNKIGDKQLLRHILIAISEIETYTNGVSLSAFLQNSMMRFASIKQIEIIGEAANSISKATKMKFTDIEWQQITGMRHVLVHEYFGVDNQLVWQVIMKDMPVLKAKIENVIDEL